MASSDSEQSDDSKESKESSTSSGSTRSTASKESDESKEENLNYDKVIDGEWDREEAIRELRIERLGLKKRTKKKPNKQPGMGTTIAAIIFTVVGILLILGLKIYNVVTPRRCYYCNYTSTDPKYEDIENAPDRKNTIMYDDFNMCINDQTWNATCRSQLKKCDIEDSCGLLVVRKHQRINDGAGEIYHDTITAVRDCFPHYPVDYRFRLYGRWVTVRGESVNQTYVNILNSTHSNDYINVTVRAKMCQYFNNCNGEEPKSGFLSQIGDSKTFISIKTGWFDFRLKFWTWVPSWLNFIKPASVVNYKPCS